MTFKNKTFGEERALYGIQYAIIENCRFAGKADGESALKETKKLAISNCDFLLRYPLWHTSSAVMDNCTMGESCRAALWYDDRIIIKNSVLGGIKAVRECKNIELYNCKINSTEFGWYSDNLTLEDCGLISEYPFLNSSGLKLNHLTMKGKYSFQYVNNAEIHNSELDTKDAFWHGKNITVYDSIVKGEYLGWYSENLKFVRCKIIGTQPLCYAKGLILEDCETIDCDLAFEKSDVNAKIKGSIISVKNPMSGYISADKFDEIIIDEYGRNTTCEIKETH